MSDRQQRRLRRELSTTQDRTDEIDEKLMRDAKRLIRSGDASSDSRRRRVIRRLRETGNDS